MNQSRALAAIGSDLEELLNAWSCVAIEQMPDSSLLDESLPFAALQLGLDKRLSKATAKMGFVYATMVQAKFIPLALSGKDILARARTGSGKTAAYSLPLLQKLLVSKAPRGVGPLA